jgi:hypothetical protein
MGDKKFALAAQQPPFDDPGERVGCAEISLTDRIIGITITGNTLPEVVS